MFRFRGMVSTSALLRRDGRLSDSALIAVVRDFAAVTPRSLLAITAKLQAALWREAVNAVVSGLASVEDVDTAISAGPGLRWAVMGPHMTLHLGGGDGGLQVHAVGEGGPTFLQQSRQRRFDIEVFW